MKLRTFLVLIAGVAFCIPAMAKAITPKSENAAIYPVATHKAKKYKAGKYRKFNRKRKPARARYGTHRRQQ